MYRRAGDWNDMNRMVEITLLGLAVPAVAFLAIVGLEMRERLGKGHGQSPKEVTLSAHEMNVIGKP